MSAPIRKLLIANRGEIACRIMRTAAAKGIATVAVYSDADAGAVHVKQADEAVHIGPSPAAQSYLNIDAIIEAAHQTGTDAIHPGYGFLSENSGFAEASAAAGLTFIGPPASAIASMGDKATAKTIMEEAGVPTVPGYRDSQDDAVLAKAAEAIGTPLLIKAVAGGGGRGMRRGDDLTAFREALTSARREAQSAFGNGDVMLEKCITSAKHIEVQIIGDAHGNVLHLGERDCTAQRRHQKVIEEAPSPSLTAAQREAICADAVTAAKAVSYINAGTVEFLLADDGAHYFLEMNTRLQVEHPVTEEVTGIDLVAWQLRVAAGGKLTLEQKDITPTGHSIEARLYAEDPAADFAPQTGRVLHWRPQDAELRIDDGITEGDAITPHYDPMIAKIIAHGSDRVAAIQHLAEALRKAPLLGLRTNRRLLINLLESDAFREASLDTATLDRWVETGNAAIAPKAPASEDFAIAGAFLALERGGDWWRSSGIAECPLTIFIGEDERDVHLTFERSQLTNLIVDGETIAVAEPRFEDRMLSFTLDGIAQRATVLRDGATIWLDRSGTTLTAQEADPTGTSTQTVDSSRITAPVSGLIQAMPVVVGDKIEVGQTLAVIEAMKMETVLTATASGKVKAIAATEGAQAKAGDVLIELELDDNG